LSKASNTAGILESLGWPGEPGSLFELAVTHRSYAFEQPDPPPHNERLELLGDSVLGLIVTDQVFHAYPELAEGEMATIRASVVNSVALAEVARELDLGRWIRLGRGEEASGGRDKSSVLADALEAVIGAIYLTYGMARVTGVFGPIFASRIETVVETGESFDSKGALQEAVVRTGAPRPSYEVGSSGPDHDKRFVARVFVRGELFGAGSGRSKKEAELNAAREALGRLNGNSEHVTDRISESEADARAS
jgi:ribonuclease III